MLKDTGKDTEVQHLSSRSFRRTKEKKRHQKGRNYKIIGKNFLELKRTMNFYLKEPTGGTQVASSVKHLLISAQAMISQSVISSPTSGSALLVQSLLGILCFSLFLCPSFTLALFSLSKTNIKKKKKRMHWMLSKMSKKSHKWSHTSEISEKFLARENKLLNKVTRLRPALVTRL